MGNASKGANKGTVSSTGSLYGVSCVFELLYSRVRRFMGFEPQYPLEEVNQRKQCRVLRILRTPTFPTGVRLVCHMLFEHLNQAAFTNACIARE